MANNMGMKITQKGTELPLLNLKGKPYLQVAHRLVWFREEHPVAEIVTDLIKLEENYAVVAAKIMIDGKIVGSAHKKETEDNFPDFIEKAETGAIGRALAMAGFGTQFEPELDEGDRLADSPIEPGKKVKNASTGNSNLGREPAKSNNANTKTEKAAPAYSRETLEQAVKDQAKKIVDSNKMKLEDLTSFMQTTYGNNRVKDLKDDQLKDLLLNLQQLLKG